jgi:hypothetical protein
VYLGRPLVSLYEGVQEYPHVLLRYLPRLPSFSHYRQGSQGGHRAEVYLGVQRVDLREQRREVYSCLPEVYFDGIPLVDLGLLHTPLAR